MAKHIIHIIGTFLIFAAIVNGDLNFNGQCTARDYCCHGGTDSNWTTAGIDAHASCVIEGVKLVETDADPSLVVESDCPAGFGFVSNNGYPAPALCANGKENYASVKSCATSNSCSSVNDVCGLPSSVCTAAQTQKPFSR